MVRHWGDRELVLLVEMRSERFSFEDIAKRLNRTKNSCVGKAYRLGLPTTEFRAVPKKRQHTVKVPTRKPVIKAVETSSGLQIRRAKLQGQVKLPGRIMASIRGNW